MKKDSKLKFQPPGLLLKFLLLGFLLLTVPTFAQTQNKTVTGTVTDENKIGMPGVTVLIKGTKISTVTNFDGNYKINVSNTNATLIFSYMGYENMEISIGSKNLINAALKESTSQLSEVVVVGYGTQKKANLTGAVSTVTAKAIEDRPVTSLQSALQGTTPGLNITRTNGQPGNESLQIQIRGASSANGAVNPLLLVDGVATSLFTLQTINPLDVETITVLKDGAAAAIYGAQAAGGVILVTTKKGKEGKTTFTYSSLLAIQKPLYTPDRMSLIDEANLSNLARKNAGVGPEYSAIDLENIQNGVPYIVSPSNPNNYIFYNQRDFTKDVIKDQTYIKTHNFSASGGSQKTNYLFSLGHLSQDGMLKVGPEGFSRFNLRMNVGTQLTKHITLDTKVSYAAHDRDMPSTDLSGGAYSLLANLYKMRLRNPLLTPEGRINSQAGNIYGLLTEGGYDTRQIDDLDGNFKLTMKDFVKGLKFTSIYGRKMRTENGETFDRTVTLWGRLQPNGYLNNPNSYSVYKATLTTENFQFLTDYNLTIAQNHKFAVLAGYQWEDYRHSNLNAGAKSLLSNDTPTLNLGDQTTRTNSESILTYANQSYFGRFNYSYKDKYLVEATLRSDESSRLAPGLRVKIFPATSLGWNIHKEKWFSNNVSFVSELKPRVSWGQLGNAQGIGYYDFLSTLSYGTSLVLGGSEGKTTYFYQGGVPSSELSWETVETYNYGIDFGFFSNKLTGSFDYYTKENKNMLTPLQLPGTFGIGTPKINNGVLQSWGWELEVNYKNKIGKDFNYGVGFNLSDNQNKLIDYAGRSVIGGGTNSIIEGFPLNTIWGYKTKPGYINTAEELAAAPTYSSLTGIGDIAYIDQNGDGKINGGKGTVEDHGDLVLLGTTQQRYLFGANVNASWKNLDFSIFVQGVGKRSIVPDTQMIVPFGESWFSPLPIHLDYWTPENPNAAFPRPYLKNRHNYATSDRWTLNAAYARLKNVQFGYSLSKSVTDKIGISRLRFYVSAEDIATISKFGIFKTVFDPEQRDRIAADYPMFGTVSFGVNLSF